MTAIGPTGSESLALGVEHKPALTLMLPAVDVGPLVDHVTAAVLDRLSDAAASPWLNVTAAAEYLGWPKKRLYNLVAANEIPHRKQGNRLLFNRHELDRWLDLHYNGPNDLRP
jgi:excisionase family DNA binding protein